MLHYIGNKTKFCEPTLNDFIVEKFPEIVKSVYNKTVPRQVSEKKMKLIRDIFNNEFEVIYWTRDFTYPDNDCYLGEEEEPEIICENCELDEEEIILLIEEKFEISKLEAIKVFNDSATFFVNYYYGDTETYCYVFKQRELKK